MPGDLEHYIRDVPDYPHHAAVRGHAVHSLIRYPLCPPAFHEPSAHRLGQRGFVSRSLTEGATPGG